MKKRFQVFLAVLAILPTMAFAQDASYDQFTPITTGVSFLSVAPDARGGGMGDTGGASAPDGDSQYWNPAKYAFIDGVGGANVSYVPWLRKLVSDIDLVSASGYYKIQDVQTIAASFRFFSIGEVLINQSPDTEGFNVKPYDLALDVSYSRILAKNFSMGVALRFIWSDLTGGYTADGTEYTVPGWSIAADISGYYGQKVDFAWGTGFGAFGFNISNIGKKVEYGDYTSAAFLPTNLRLGGRFTMPIDKYNHITAHLDINKLLVPARPIKGAEESNESYAQRLDNYYKMDPITGIGMSFVDMPDGSAYGFESQFKRLMWSAGIEYDYNEQFFGRVGLYYEDPSVGGRQYATFGAGFKLNVFSLDVAYVLSIAQNNPLDQTLRFTLGFNIGGMKELIGFSKDDKKD
jgi:hypothetical protein